jgi:hypothetical protein
MFGTKNVDTVRKNKKIMDKETTTKSKWSVIMWRIVSVLAIVLSIIAICRSFYRTVDLGFDYMGVIVGVLAILLTCLVAWNIYSAIDANKKIDDMRNELIALRSSINIDRIAYEKSINKLKAELYDNVVSINRQSLGFEKSAISMHMLINMISSISFLAKAEEYSKAEPQIDYYYVMTKDDIDLIRKDVDKDTCRGLLRLLYEIPNKGKLQNFSKLEELIQLVCAGKI